MDLDSLEKTTTSSNLERGKLYFNQDKVEKFTLINNRFVSATVSGSKEYRVFMKIKEHPIESFCSCPYKSKGNCKHLVAVILALIDTAKNPTEIHITVSDKKEKVLEYGYYILNLFYKTRNKLLKS